MNLLDALRGLNDEEKRTVIDYCEAIRRGDETKIQEIEKKLSIERTETPL